MEGAASRVAPALSPAKLTARQVRDSLTKVPFNMLVGRLLGRVHRDGITFECALRPD